MAKRQSLEEEVQKEAADYLMWVGSVYYPTVQEFISEATQRGVCKRLGQLPKDFVLGKSRIFLAHDDGVTGEGFIFGYFTPQKLEYIVKREEDLPDHLWERVSMVYLKTTFREPARLCGTRHEGLYAVVEAEHADDGFVFFDKPRKLNFFMKDEHHFRGLLRFAYGPWVLAVKVKRAFFTPPSWKAAPAIEPGTPWSAAEDAELIAALEQSSNVKRSAQKLAYKTGRSRTALLYRYNKICPDIYSEDTEGDQDG